MNDKQKKYLVIGILTFIILFIDPFNIKLEIPAFQIYGFQIGFFILFIGYFVMVYYIGKEDKKE